MLSNVQILTGKLQNRALDPPVRDVYDIAVCGIEDPQSLEAAINGIYAAKIDSTILGWNMNRDSHAEATDELIKQRSLQIATSQGKTSGICNSRRGERTYTTM